MKQNIFNKERAEIAEFAPLALIHETEQQRIFMDVPCRATNNLTGFRLRMIYDEDAQGEIEKIRVYALSPTFGEIKRQLISYGLTEEEIDALFHKDAAGNHQLRTMGELSGAMAIAYANAHLSLVANACSDPELLHRLAREPESWQTLLPPFGVESCGKRIPRQVPQSE